MSANEGRPNSRPGTERPGTERPGTERPGTEREGGERIQKVLARAGFGSRRVCEELVAAGKVTVNGAPAHLGARIAVESDEVLVDGVRVGIAPGLVYYLLNKPAGVVTTARDPEGRRTVVELVPRAPRVFAVGRLDAQSEGLLILTNDGELAQALAHPSHGVEKEYLVELDREPSPGALRRLREGVELEPGLWSAPARVARRGPRLLRIVLHEGRNRQVRRMCASIGCTVERLVRVRIGPVGDSRLRPGAYRALSPAEVRALRVAAEAPRGRSGRSR